jgi:chitin synthase
MVAVLVGIAVQVSEEGLLAPSSLFLVIVSSSFIIAAIMHPLEFGCLIHGLVYFITIPSMYLLLIIFSIFNLNNVSWGTREGPKIKTKQVSHESVLCCLFIPIFPIYNHIIEFQS